MAVCLVCELVATMVAYVAGKLAYYEVVLLVDVAAALMVDEMVYDSVAVKVD